MGRPKLEPSKTLNLTLNLTTRGTRVDGDATEGPNFSIALPIFPCTARMLCQERIF